MRINGGEISLSGLCIFIWRCLFLKLLPNNHPVCCFRFRPTDTCQAESYLCPPTPSCGTHNWYQYWVSRDENITYDWRLIQVLSRSFLKRVNGDHHAACFLRVLVTQYHCESLFASPFVFLRSLCPRVTNTRARSECQLTLSLGDQMNVQNTDVISTSC